MAAINNTFKTYDAKGIREELSDVIYNIDPTETPFLNSCGKGKISNTYFEWQQDSLAATDSTNVQLEGDDIATYPAVAPTSRIGNYAQISRKLLVLSDTEEVVRKAGRKSELAYQMSKRSSELKRDMEVLLLANTPGNAGAAATARQTAGLLTWIRTNVDMGAGGVNPAAPNPYPTAGRTDGTQRALAEPNLKNAIQLAWQAGGSPKTVMVNGPQKQVISGFSGIATRYKDVKGSEAAVIIAAADVYVSDFGTLTVIPNRFQRNRDLFILDWDYLEVDYLRPFATTPLAKTGDATKRMLIVEYGLRVKHEHALALVADLS